MLIPNWVVISLGTVAIYICMYIYGKRKYQDGFNDGASHVMNLHIEKIINSTLNSQEDEDGEG